LNNLQRYDTYDRAKSKVYVGEYAAHDKDRVNTLRSALAEAAYLTSLERNADVVHLASYAPLLAKQGRTQWRPDMIYFNNTKLVLSANYYVQQMFGQNSGDVYLPIKLSSAAPELAVSCVQDSKSGDVILKLVNASTNTVATRLDLAGVGKIKPTATRTVLAGDLAAGNFFNEPSKVVPQTDAITISEPFHCDLPANSFTLLRFKTR
jgi:alpha-L-arabinofuranosidase